jgi:hypothetical protein
MQCKDVGVGVIKKVYSGPQKDFQIRGATEEGE